MRTGTDASARVAFCVATTATVDRRTGRASGCARTSGRIPAPTIVTPSLSLDQENVSHVSLDGCNLGNGQSLAHEPPGHDHEGALRQPAREPVVDLRVALVASSMPRSSDER